MGLPVDVIVVQEQREQPDVVSLRLGLGVLLRPDGERVGVADAVAVQLDELRRVDRLTNAVLLEREVRRGADR